LEDNKINKIFDAHFAFLEEVEAEVGLYADTTEAAAERVQKDFGDLPGFRLIEVQEAPEGKYKFSKETLN
jgi:hypothetical protein